MFSGSTLTSSAVLAAARRARVEADAAEVRVLSQAIEWAHLHSVESTNDAATWGDSPVPIAGQGAPLVSEFCIHEFASALGMSPDSGRALIAHALETYHRLPRVWQRVQAGDLQVWRARRVAEKTLPLSLEAAEHVDRHVAGFAHQIGIAALDRLVDEAIARFMPELAEELAVRAADGRFVRIDHEQISFAGTSRISGELDLTDALDLEAALQAGAQQLADLGVQAHLDARRAMTLGHLARGETALEFLGPDVEPVEMPRARQPRQPRQPRQIVLYVHLSQAALTGHSGVARVENTRTLITADLLAGWCGLPNTKITVKPVIDLNDHLSVESYEIPDRIREHVVLRDQTCVFPWCTRPARSCDLDHVVPHGDEGGPTSTDNLGPLCRRHHRLKTFGQWTYTTLEPGTYLWRSPHGYTYLRDGTGTRDLTPGPVDPPGS